MRLLGGIGLINCTKSFAACDTSFETGWLLLLGEFCLVEQAKKPSHSNMGRIVELPAAAPGLWPQHNKSFPNESGAIT